MKLLKTNNIATVNACQYYFNFELSSVVLTKRTDKFEQQFQDISNNTNKWRHLSQPLGGLTFLSSYSTTTSLGLLSPCYVMCEMPNKRQY